MCSFNIEKDKIANVYINFKQHEIGFFVGKFLIEKYRYAPLLPQNDEDDG
jgi:hypothetical protein